VENLHLARLVQQNFETACHEGDLQKTKAALRFGKLAFPGQPTALAEVTINYFSDDCNFFSNFFTALLSAMRKEESQSELVDFMLDHPMFDVNNLTPCTLASSAT
jgi:hypothetical protein